MNKIISIILFIFFCSCSLNKNRTIHVKEIKNLKVGMDSLRRIYPKVIEPLASSDWVDEYSYYIKQKSPDFTIDYNQQDFLIVPSLSIPIEVLEKDNIELSKYFDKGKIELEYSKIYVLENNILVGVLNYIGKERKPYSPVTFNKKLKKIKIYETLNESDLYFEIVFKYGDGVLFIPGVVFYSDKQFQFLNLDDNNIHPINELYRSWSPSKVKFRSFINGLIDSTQKEIYLNSR